MMKGALVLFLISLQLLMNLANKLPNASDFNYDAFRQSDYTIKFERMELIRYNKDYFHDASIKTFKYNRTTPLVNATFTTKVNAGSELTTVVQVYKFMSNEYRHFPIRFAVPTCKAFKANLAGMRASIKCGNFTGCPVLKGVTYHICYWTIDPSLFPPYMPNGNYMIELQGLFGSVDITVIRGYGSVDRPIPWQ